MGYLFCRTVVDSIYMQPKKGARITPLESSVTDIVCNFRCVQSGNVKEYPNTINILRKRTNPEEECQNSTQSNKTFKLGTIVSGPGVFNCYGLTVVQNDGFSSLVHIDEKINAIECYRLSRIHVDNLTQASMRYKYILLWNLLLHWSGLLLLCLLCALFRQVVCSKSFRILKWGQSSLSINIYDL